MIRKICAVNLIILYDDIMAYKNKYDKLPYLFMSSSTSDAFDAALDKIDDGKQFTFLECNTFIKNDLEYGDVELR